MTVEAVAASYAISGCTSADSPRSSWPACWAYRGRELNDIECGRVDMPAHVKERLLEEL